MAAPKEFGKAQRNHSPENWTDQRQKPGTDHCGGESHLARMVWLFQAQPEKCVRRPGQLDTRTNASHPAQAPPSERMGADARPQALAQCLLRRTRAILDGHSPRPSEPISMEKSLTGEPDAGNPPVRFGGRGGAKTPSLPLSIESWRLRDCCPISLQFPSGKLEGNWARASAAEVLL